MRVNNALQHANTLIAQAHRRSGCMGTTVSLAGMRLQKHTPVAAAGRSYNPFWGLFSDLVWWRMAGREVEMVRLSTMRLCMHGHALYTADMCTGRPPACSQPSLCWCTRPRIFLDRPLPHRVGTSNVNNRGIRVGQGKHERHRADHTDISHEAKPGLRHCPRPVHLQPLRTDGSCRQK